MAEKIFHTLEGVSETLLMRLYARAHESQRPDAMLKDDKAVEIVRQLAGDFSRLRMQRHDEIPVIMRMRKFDKHAHDFLARNPNGIVVHIGCGLDGAPSAAFDEIPGKIIQANVSGHVVE